MDGWAGSRCGAQSRRQQGVCAADRLSGGRRTSSGAGLYSGREGYTSKGYHSRKDPHGRRVNSAAQVNSQEDYSWLRIPTRTLEVPSTDEVILARESIRPSTPTVLMKLTGFDVGSMKKPVDNGMPSSVRRLSLMEGQLSNTGNKLFTSSIGKGEYREKSRLAVNNSLENPVSKNRCHDSICTSRKNARNHPYIVQKDRSNIGGHTTSTVGYDTRGNSISLSRQMSKLRQLGKRGNRHSYSCTVGRNQSQRISWHSDVFSSSRKGSLPVFPDEKVLSRASKPIGPSPDKEIKMVDSVNFSRVDHKYSCPVHCYEDDFSKKVLNQMPYESIDSWTVLSPASKASGGIGFWRDEYNVQRAMEFSLECDKKDAKVKALQQSPISVLEPGMETESSSSGCCNQVAADIHELQAQLKLTNFVSMEIHAGDEFMMLGEDSVRLEDEGLELVDDIQFEFGDDEERDFSYLLDILIASGIHSASQDQDRLHKVCHSLECPVGPGVFEILEKKYSNLFGWTRPERMLLFDRVNRISSELLAPSLDLFPWVKSGKRIGPMWGAEGLVEKVWQVLEQRREKIKPWKGKKSVPELVDCGKWQHTAVDAVGRAIAREIWDCLVEETIVGLL